MTDLLLAIKDFGLQAVITIAVLYGGWKLICMMIKSLEDANARWQKTLEESNVRWQKVIEGLQTTIENHRNEVKEAHGYQRTEHEKLSLLQDEQLERSSKITDLQNLQLERSASQLVALNGIQEAIGRINGYSK